MPVQSSKLLLVLDSTVILGFELRPDPWPYFCSFQTFECFEMGPHFRREDGVWPMLVTPRLLGSDSAGVHSHSLTYSLLSECYWSKPKLCYVQRSVVQAVLVSSPIWAHDLLFITLWQLRSCFCGTPSLTRGRVCLLYMLLALSSTVILGSESRGNRDHILLSQIWDVPFRRLLRLAGSRWRHSFPPPHGLPVEARWYSCYNLGTNPTEKEPLPTIPLLLRDVTIGADPERTPFSGVLPYVTLHDVKYSIVASLFIVP
jgi:hypothetical protein